MRYYILSAFLLFTSSIFAQKADYKMVAVGFYNLENLFDTENDTLINDEDFLPDGKRAWTEEKYKEKVANMAYVISQMGKEMCPTGLSILGVAEIENRKVLEDIIAQPSLSKRDYQIIHYNSIDRRGVDVGLFYNPKHFEVTHTKPHRVKYMLEDSTYLRTRDILEVTGKLDGEDVSILVNHWPSRWGGEKVSGPKRIKAAATTKSIIDSLQIINPEAKVIVMGDLNDDPTSISVTQHLNSVGVKEKVGGDDVYNPMFDFYQRGIGSNAYRDGWSLFDQFLITPPFLDQKQKGYFYYKTIIFNKKYLIQRSGRFRGYPFRTFSFDKYQGGYSDHFPIVMYLAKRLEK